MIERSQNKPIGPFFIYFTSWLKADLWLAADLINDRVP